VAAGGRRDAPGGGLRPPGRPSWSQGYEVAIEVEDGILTVSGERQEDRTDMGGGRYVRRERRFGAFSRSLALPSRVDAQVIKAQTRDAWSR
jgi:HSP20 family molecular chaperone IbpA